MSECRKKSGNLRNSGKSEEVLRSGISPERVWNCLDRWQSPEKSGRLESFQACPRVASGGRFWGLGRCASITSGVHGPLTLPFRARFPSSYPSFGSGVRVFQTFERSPTVFADRSACVWARLIPESSTPLRAAHCLGGTPPPRVQRQRGPAPCG